MRLSRRDLLRLAGAAGVASLVGCGPRLGTLGELLRSHLPLPEPFQVPLPVPPVARPVRSDGDTDYYELTQREAVRELLPGVPTPVWGYDGLFPGPTIVSRAGRRTVVRHRNELTVPVSVHLHGGHTPAEHDGYPTDLVLPVDGAGSSPAGSGHLGHDAGWSFHDGERD